MRPVASPFLRPTFPLYLQCTDYSRVGRGCKWRVFWLGRDLNPQPSTRQCGKLTPETTVHPFIRLLITITFLITITVITIRITVFANDSTSALRSFNTQSNLLKNFWVHFVDSQERFAVWKLISNGFRLFACQTLEQVRDDVVQRGATTGAYHRIWKNNNGRFIFNWHSVIHTSLQGIYFMHIQRRLVEMSSASRRVFVGRCYPLFLTSSHSKTATTNGQCHDPQGSL